MGRTLDEVIRSLPKAEREKIHARYLELKNEVLNLRALREAAGKAQTELARRLKISQPSVSKMEKQADMYLSTLRSYVEAMGGELELVVRFPGLAPIQLGGLGDEHLPRESRKRSAPTASAPRRRVRVKA